MTDYGHDLQFGTFITPTASPAQQAVELAVLSEQVGLDLVTFQDHPYQPRFYDTWTLISYVASKTQSIHISANVTNLPLRMPSIIARSVASLDLLSNGRIELGIGAGGFWDAIVAMGGRRLTAGESIEALEEAIEIIRALWDTSGRAGLHFEGKHYQVNGAKRGPAPAHDVGIWIGAYKPRILKLTGRVADGWLPSYAYLGGGLPDLAGMNQHLDEGARSAGREPSAIRRMLNINGQFTRAGDGSFLNGMPNEWAEQMAEVTFNYGISTFILGTDDPNAIELFGREVAPLTRELVSRGRG